MENFNNPQPLNQFNSFMPQKNLPNSTAVLVLGICSIVTCFCWGLVGLICGIIALVLAKKDLELYKSSPGDYLISSYNNLKGGRICAIIGVCISALYLIWIILYFVFIGTMLTMVPWGNLH